MPGGSALRAALASCALLAGAGCNGGGRIELVSLDYRSIDPPAPHPQRIDLDECYWWAEEDGQVHVAMQRRGGVPLLGPAAAWRLQLSLVLEKLPSGEGRNYTVGRRELRGVLRVGAAEARYESVTGIVALYREGDDGLRGSVRLLASRQVSQVIAGFGAPHRQVILGTFEAVRDETRGRAIETDTEIRGWERPPDARNNDPPMTPMSTDNATNKYYPCRSVSCVDRLLLDRTGADLRYQRPG
jgi:hypothetical protein